MATMRTLYDQADALKQERIGLLHQHGPNAKLMGEVSELQAIMTGLVRAFTQAGGTKVTEHLDSSPAYWLRRQVG